jgi:hypothetical protein
MRIAFVAAVPLAAACFTVPAAAQVAMPSRAVLLENVERSRRNILKYVDAAPDSVLGFRPMPGVRTFGEQIEHAAGATTFIIASAWQVKLPAAPGDTATRRHDRAALRAFVNERYDRFAGAVRDVSVQRLTIPATYAGTTAAGWRWVDTALEHATWTLGQTVPYLRANGVKPPEYLPF